MPTPTPQDWQLLDRYLAGEASPDEQAQVRAGANTEPAWAEALELLRADFAARRTTPRDTDLAWSQMRSRLAAEADTVVRHAGIARRTPLHATRAFRAAAAVLIVASSLAAWQILATRRDAQPYAQFANDITTPNGTRQTITLGDGSRVTLNAGSRLRWAADFGVRARDIHLDGEAYFAVAHDAARPFRVHARGAVAHDLGTRFTVRAYPELPEIEVVVAEGAVSLRHDRPAADSAILRVGQMGRLGQFGAPTVESSVPVERWTAWTTGSLVLDGLTLAEAIPQLERWYDVTIAVPDARLAARRVTSRFHDETLSQALDALTLALGARWQQSEHAVTLLPGPH